MKESFFLVIAIVFITIPYGLKADTVSYKYSHNPVSGNVVSKNINIEIENRTTINTRSTPTLLYEDPTEVGKITIYPNPASCEVRIQFNGPEWNQNYNRSEWWALSLYSIEGALLKTEKCQGHLGNIIISSFPVGMYILRIERGGLCRSYPLIKK